MNNLNKNKINESINILNIILKIVLIFLVILLFYIFLLINKELKIIQLFITILKIISPLFFGILIAYLLNPIVSKFKIKRLYSSLIVYFIIILILGLFIWFIFPNLKNQIIDINKYLPEFIDNINIFLNNLISKFSLSSEFKINIKTFIGDYLLIFTRDFPNNCLNIINNTISVISFIVLSLITGFYILLDFDNFKNNIFILLPKKKRRRFKNLFKQIFEYIFIYIKETFLIILIVFILSLISFTIFDIKAPIFFALLNAFTNIIPYIGPIIGAVPIVLISFMSGVKTGVFISVSLVIIQVIENLFIHPILMGKNMKLHPVTILISLLIFDYFFGIIGMCIAVPIVAILKTIILFIDKKYNIFNFDKIMIVEGRK